jgi:hypothetical protein
LRAPSRTTIHAAAFLLATSLLAACGDDDTADQAASGDRDDLEEAIAEEAAELGVELSDEELAEAAGELDSSDMPGEAEVTLDGEDLPMDGVRCIEEESTYVFEARGPGGDFEVWFGTHWSGDEEGEYNWDSPNGMRLWAMPDGIPYNDIVPDSAEVTAQEGTASGSMTVERGGDFDDPPVELTFDLRCD